MCFCCTYMDVLPSQSASLMFPRGAFFTMHMDTCYNETRVYTYACICECVHTNTHTSVYTHTQIDRHVDRSTDGQKGR